MPLYGVISGDLIYLLHTKNDGYKNILNSYSLNSPMLHIAESLIKISSEFSSSCKGIATLCELLRHPEVFRMQKTDLDKTKTKFKNMQLNKKQIRRLALCYSKFHACEIIRNDDYHYSLYTNSIA